MATPECGLSGAGTVEEIPASRLLSVISILFPTLLCGAWVFALGSAWQHWGAAMDLRYVPIIGIALGLPVLLYGIWQEVKRWRRNVRIRMGADRLQLIAGTSEVIGEIPYENIAELAARRVGRGGPRVLIRLIDPARGDWAWEQPPGFRDYLQSRYGFDIMVHHPVGWAAPGDAILRRMQARLDAWRSRRPAAVGTLEGSL